MTNLIIPAEHINWSEAAKAVGSLGKRLAMDQEQKALARPIDRDFERDNPDLQPGVDPLAHSHNHLKLAQLLLNEGILTDTALISVVHERERCDFFTRRGDTCNCHARVLVSGRIYSYDGNKW